MLLPHSFILRIDLGPVERASRVFGIGLQAYHATNGVQKAEKSSVRRNCVHNDAEFERDGVPDVVLVEDEESKGCLCRHVIHGDTLSQGYFVVNGQGITKEVVDQEQWRPSINELSQEVEERDDLNLMYVAGHME